MSSTEQTLGDAKKFADANLTPERVAEIRAEVMQDLAENKKFSCETAPGLAHFVKLGEPLFGEEGKSSPRLAHQIMLVIHPDRLNQGGKEALWRLACYCGLLKDRLPNKKDIFLHSGDGSDERPVGTFYMNLKQKQREGKVLEDLIVINPDADGRIEPSTLTSGSVIKANVVIGVGTDFGCIWASLLEVQALYLNADGFAPSSSNRKAGFTTASDDDIVMAARLAGNEPAVPQITAAAGVGQTTTDPNSEPIDDGSSTAGDDIPF